MPRPPDLTALANKIRKYIQSQDWTPFLQYDNQLSFTITPNVRRGKISVLGCQAGIRCADGAILNDNSLASDADVINLYTSSVMYGNGRNGDAAAVFAYLLDILRQAKRDPRS